MGTPFCYNSEATYPEHVANCTVQVTGCLQELPSEKLHQSKQAPRAQSTGDITIIKQ